MTSLLCCFRSPSPPPPPASDSNANIITNTDNDSGYFYSPPPPPRYTPRPASVHEKTLEAHFPSRPGTPEKRHTERVSTDSASDASSALSFPSSYGNTSTATGDTPPPPYSPRPEDQGPPRRYSRSMSVSSGLSTGAGIAVPPQAHVAPSRPAARVSGGYSPSVDAEK